MHNRNYLIALFLPGWVTLPLELVNLQHCYLLFCYTVILGVY